MIKGDYRLEKAEISEDLGLNLDSDVLDIHTWKGVKTRIIRTKFDGYKHSCYTFIGEQFIASGGLDGKLFLYDLNGSKVREFVGHEGDILDVVSSKDGRWLVSCSSDQTIMLWDFKYLRPRSRQAGFGSLLWRWLEEIFSKEEFQNMKKKIDELPESNLDKRAWANYFYYLASRCDKTYPALTIFLTKEDDWIAWNKDGFFTSSLIKLWERVGYFLYRSEGTPSEFISFNQLYDVYYRPDLLKLNFEDSAKYSNIAHTMLKRERLEEKIFISLPPPKAKIISPRDGEIVHSDVIDVEVVVENPYGEIGDIRLYHNGKLISSDGVFIFYRDPKWVAMRTRMPSPYEPTVYEEFIPYESPVEKTYQVKLVPGVNTIACQAMNAKNHILSGRSEVKVKCEIEGSPHLYLLAVGVQNFKEKRANLNFTHNDAKGLSNVIARYRGDQYSWVDVIPLLDPDKNKIKEAIFRLRDIILPNDTFIFYASTHGEVIATTIEALMNRYNYYLLTSNFAGEINEEVTINTHELLEFSKLIPALNQIYILDTCYSGAAEIAFSDLYNRRLSCFAVGGGMHLLTGSTVHGLAMEGFNEHGLFTYYLLRALRGFADLNKDKKVTFLEVAEYIKKNLEKEFGGFQKPEILYFGRDIVMTEKQ